MTANGPSPTPGLAPVYRYLMIARLSIRLNQLTGGVSWTVGIFLAAWTLAALADLAFPLVGPSIRLPGLVAVLTLTMAAIIRFWVLPSVRPLTYRRLAEMTESRTPELENRLVTCIDLDGQDVATNHWNRLVRETVVAMQQAPPPRVTLAETARAMLPGIVAALAMMLMSVALGKRFDLSFPRVLLPFDDLPPYRDVVFELTPRTGVALGGDEIEFEVRVTSGTADAFRLELVGEVGSKPITMTMEKVGDGRFRKTAKGLQAEPGFARSFSFRVYGGGTWSTLRTIDWVERPAIQKLGAKLHFPDYLALSRSPVELADPRTISGPLESSVEIRAAVRGEVTSGFLELSEPRLTRRLNESRKERLWHSSRNRFPEESKRVGVWTWDETLGQGPDAHISDGTGFSSHGFVGSAPFPVDRGELLFVHVLLDPDRPPEMIALEFTPSGGGSEHRAFWGKDRFEVGTPQSASRRQVGDLPEKGKWVRLEVPASLLNLEARSITGVSFIAVGGRVGWFQIGASEPSAFEQTIWTVTQTVPLIADSEGDWVGRFPLRSVGRFRIQAENRLGHANRLEEGVGTFEAIPDRPPTIVVEKPGRDVTVSEAVPLQITVEDDFGLKEVVLSIHRAGEEEYRKFETLRTYPTPDPARSDSIEARLDPQALGLKPGESLQYRVEVADRQPGAKPVASKEFTLTREAETTPEKKPRPLTEAFRKLAGEQAKIRDRLEKMLAGKNEDEAKQLKDLADQESKNAEAARQIQEELAKQGQEGKQNPKENPDLKKSRDELLKKLQMKANQPLEEMKDELDKAARADAGKRNLEDLHRRAGELQQNLQQLTQQAEAMAKLPPEMKSTAKNGNSPDGTATQGKNPSGMIGASLKELDERTRNLILQMPSRVREELLQSMNEQGPEAFRPFIQDYFRRLSELTNPR